MNSCISTTSHPDVVEFNQAGTGGHILSQKVSFLYFGSVLKDCKSFEEYKFFFQNEDYRSMIECYPLYSMLLAIGQTKIDFFSLGKYQLMKATPESLKSPWISV